MHKEVHSFLLETSSRFIEQKHARGMNELTMIVAYTSDLITFPPAPLKLWPYGAI